jgi:type III secretion protein S
VNFATQIIQLSNQALYLILLMSAPPILIATVLGLVVAIFQAATQIQEQNLSFVIKLTAVVFTIMYMAGFIGGLIMQYTQTIFTQFPKWG